MKYCAISAIQCDGVKLCQNSWTRAPNKEACRLPGPPRRSGTGTGTSTYTGKSKTPRRNIRRTKQKQAARPGAQEETVRHSSSLVFIYKFFPQFRARVHPSLSLMLSLRTCSCASGRGGGGAILSSSSAGSLSTSHIRQSPSTPPSSQSSHRSPSAQLA